METEIKILDKGFVRLVDHMGSDLSVVEAARVSYNQGSKGKEKDDKLIDYMLKHSHETPFEMISFKFHAKLPIFVMRQWSKHRISSTNEVSGRYIELENEFYVPEQWRTQHKNNKQGSNIESLVGGSYGEDEEEIEVTSTGEIQLHTEEGTFIEYKNFQALFQDAYDSAYSFYEKLLTLGAAKELARVVLPVGLYTQIYWQINFRSLMNFLKLRLAPDAQYEIRQYAEAIQELVKPLIPVSYAAFEKYVLGKET